MSGASPPPVFWVSLRDYLLRRRSCLLTAKDDVLNLHQTAKQFCAKQPNFIKNAVVFIEIDYLCKRKRLQCEDRAYYGSFLRTLSIAQNGRKDYRRGWSPRKEVVFSIVSPEWAKDNLPPFQGSYNDGVPVSYRGLHLRLCSERPFGAVN